jgi:predicted nucleic acid-binding Zn finger protein
MTMIDTRFPKAIEIAAAAGQWAKCHARDGKKLYAVPSSRDANVRHLVDGRACTCPDFQRRGQPCRHVEAVKIHCALVRAQQPKRRQQTREEAYAF